MGGGRDSHSTRTNSGEDERKTKVHGSELGSLALRFGDFARKLCGSAEELPSWMVNSGHRSFSSNLPKLLLGLHGVLSDFWSLYLFLIPMLLEKIMPWRFRFTFTCLHQNQPHFSFKFGDNCNLSLPVRLKLFPTVVVQIP